MTLKMKAVLGLLCLLILVACGPNAGPAATETPTQAPTNTMAPTETPRPTETPTVPPPAIITEGANTPAAGQPAAGQPTAAQPGANQPATGATQPAANPAGAQPAAGGSSAPDKYTYLGQDVADRTQFLPNRTVTITWTIQNSGTNGWTKEYTLRHFAGPEPQKKVYNFNKDVPVKDTINFTVTFTTPADPGEYDLWFKLTNAAGQNFGDLDLVFTVSNNPVKATATPAQ